MLGNNPHRNTNMVSRAYCEKCSKFIAASYFVIWEIDFAERKVISHKENKGTKPHIEIFLSL